MGGGENAGNEDIAELAAPDDEGEPEGRGGSVEFSGKASSQYTDIFDILTWSRLFFLSKYY